MNNTRIELLKQYIIEEPNDPFNIYALANEYLTEQPQTALEYFEKLLKNYPDYLGTYYQAGKLYAAFGQTQKAKATFESGIALALRQTNAKTLNELRSALNEILDDE
ncbi:MAG: tetratricopeptide repeat protein [Opitutaceae bacterium]|nr:tetratricopeptide repeat protein [Cytophagales bacterium]